MPATDRHRKCATIYTERQVAEARLEAAAMPGERREFDELPWPTEASQWAAASLLAEEVDGCHHTTAVESRNDRTRDVAFPSSRRGTAI